MFDELTVDLRRPPRERWRLTSAQRERARELLRVYKQDLALQPSAAESVIPALRDVLNNEYWQELESLASTIGVPVDDAVLGNCYYDILKAAFGSAFGCTAFAIDDPGGILHARNLDWWTENAALARYTAVCRFIGAPAGEFLTIGWPGFTGTFSGMAPGRFAVTLNAVMSLEPARVETPVVFLLRSVLEKSRFFDEALRALSESPIPCDCLLLLTGTSPGELAVIERTPSRYAIRRATAGYVCVTNGYQKLEQATNDGHSPLLAAWCKRFERMESLIAGQRPRNPRDCLSYLSDPGVRMEITVQQMVFRTATGEFWT